MDKNFQDIQQLDSEETDSQFSGGQPPSRTHPWCLCSTLHLSLLALSVNVLLLVTVCVIGSQSTQLREELRTLKETFNNFSSSTLEEVLALGFHGGSARVKLTSLESQLEKQQQEVKADHATLLLHLKHFPGDLGSLECHMMFLQSNGTKCCPINWVRHGGSCYWFSRAGLNWHQANEYCQLENAHLVVINSWDEQKFIVQHTSPFHTWIGLSDREGPWRWVDGTDYEHNYQNWAITQPDNWQGHEVGASEDCVEVLSSGLWNDNFCAELNRWACEMKHNLTVYAYGGRKGPARGFANSSLTASKLQLPREADMGSGFHVGSVVPVVGADAQVQRDLQTLRKNFSNFTSGTEADVQELTTQGQSLQEVIKVLKIEVEDHRDELQAVRSLKENMVSQKSTLEKKQDVLKSDQSAMLLKIQQLVKDLRTLSCEIADLKGNGSVKACCPLNWLEYNGSCYWFSESSKSWAEADKDCQLENAYLAVVNSLEEQNFIQSHRSKPNTWIGLTDQNGPWRWSDGTDYQQGFTHWSPQQPDNWYGHGLGGGEDCVHFTSDGRWNDDVCQRSYSWVCETKLEKAR
ncbi:C-type lectin domain family 10 member A-like [Thomomys bottae]